MGARKRIKGGRAPPRGAFGRPGAVSRGLRDCIFGGIEKKMAAKKEEMRGLIVDNVEICGFLTAFRRQTGVVRKKNEEIRRNLRRNPLTIPCGFL